MFWIDIFGVCYGILRLILVIFKREFFLKKIKYIGGGIFGM